MQRHVSCAFVLVTLAAAACGKHGGGRGGGGSPVPPEKQPSAPIALAEAPLAVTESEHPWQLNVVGADAGAPAAVTRAFTFKPTTGGSLSFGYFEQQTVGCANGTNVDLKVALHDDTAPGTDRDVQLEDCFDYPANHALRFVVTVDNVGRCDAVRLSLGFLRQGACR